MYRIWSFSNNFYGPVKIGFKKSFYLPTPASTTEKKKNKNIQNKNKNQKPPPPPPPTTRGLTDPHFRKKNSVRRLFLYNIVLFSIQTSMNAMKETVAAATHVSIPMEVITAHVQ